MGSKLNYKPCSHTKKDCFKNKDVGCILLHDTTFKDKEGKKVDCPFYKSSKEGKK